MKQLLIVCLAALALAACSTPQTQPAAPIGDSSTGAPPVPPPQPPVITGDIPQVKPPVGDDLSPLKDFSIYFELNEFTVSEKYLSVVRRHADYMKKNPAQRASVQGNTDERGSREYNLSLGQKRAEAVKKMLVLEGVKEAQIEAVSLGEEKPKNPGHDDAAWAENRRSDITYPVR
jgi:peptidoglycan-associated lipoprotein